MRHPGWLLVVAGLLIAAAGLVWVFAPAILGRGRLPGDMAIERDNFRFYFPLTTCLIVSGILTGVRWLVRYFSR